MRPMKCTICEKDIEENKIGYQDELTVICGACYFSGATDGKE